MLTVIQVSVMKSEMFLICILKSAVIGQFCEEGRVFFPPPNCRMKTARNATSVAWIFPHLFSRALQTDPPRTFNFLLYWPSFCAEVQLSDAHQEAEVNV